MPSFNVDNLNESLEIADRAYSFRSVSEIPEKYRQVFSCYQYFNSVQSRVLDDVLYSDRSLVLAAPTGSGKTVVFELAMVSLLSKLEAQNYNGDFKIVYIAPIKALCSEKYHEWCGKFSQYGLRILEITGDSDSSTYSILEDYHLIVTTPEKWDSLTRKWKDNKHLMQVVKLILIDEVHLLSDECRGPTMEAVVSRMKTVQGTLLHDIRMQQATLIQKEEESPQRNNLELGDISDLPVRFVAASACIPNIEDVASWLGDDKRPALFHKFNEESRPVKLKKVVLGYNCPDNWSSFRFTITLMYKLKSILLSYAEGKPSLIFCSTRKGVVQTSTTLIKDLTFRFSPEQREKLFFAANQLNDKKMKDQLLSGIGCHHAGMTAPDRYLVEDLFKAGYLPILVATSTLAMGVNLPAHLVIIMSTAQYIKGSYHEYPESQLLQMVGRAGRPQFDTSAVAVIMTKNSLKEHYERLVEGKEMLESSLHLHLAEHLNAEIVLQTITDMAVAMDWIHSTFLYVCAIRRPNRYSLVCNPPTAHKIESKLQELCMRELNALASSEIINLDGMDVKPTEMGKLMARYCVAFETMKLFQKVEGTEAVIDLIKLLSKSAEYSDIQIRTNERKVLNCLNKNKGHECIRYPISARVKTRDQKISILIQAIFGCLQIQDSGLSQECLKIIRIAQRVSKCFCQYVLNCLLKFGKKNIYKLLVSTLRLSKCFNSRLWEDSIFVARQLDGIGPAYAGLLAASGKTTFASLRDSNPRDIERILNKAPPFGNDILDTVTHMPQYKISIEKNGNIITIEISIKNEELVREHIASGGVNNFSTLVAGDPSSNVLLLRETFSDAFIINAGHILKNIELKKHQNLKEIKAHLINERWVGLDVDTSIDLSAEEAKPTESVQQYLRRFAFSQGCNLGGSGGTKGKREDESNISSSQGSVKNKITQASYFDKMKERTKMLSQTPFSSSQGSVKNKNTRASYFDELKERAKMLPQTPVLMTKRSSQASQKSQNLIEKYFNKEVDVVKMTPKHLMVEEVCLVNETIPQKRHKGENGEFSMSANDFPNESQDMNYDWNSPSYRYDELEALESSHNDGQDNFCGLYSYSQFSRDNVYHVTPLTTPTNGYMDSSLKNKTHFDEISAQNINRCERKGCDVQKEESLAIIHTMEKFKDNILIPNFDLGEDLLLEDEPNVDMI